MKIYENYIKRPQDCLIAIVALIALAPLLLALAVVIRINLGNPVIFTQFRPGLNEYRFKIYKFRTMLDSKDDNDKLLPDSLRLSKLGRELRRISLDELPELWNIIKGDMSIVGPRPHLLTDILFMTAEQRKRHSIRPGLTGLAQISGRNNISWEQRLSLDLEYMENITFVNDWTIIFRTFIKVFKKADISTDGMDTSEELGDYLLRTGKIDKDYYNMVLRS